tara:strand:+ start:914 stop:3505 length:2592 start_codon:yes stop_codon:yes gene_type:complete
MKKYYGNYLGIVVQNNDPDRRGRCKVFVPHVSITVYDKWNESPRDKRFKFVGENLTSSLNDIIDDVKDILPWAECAVPITGGVGSGRYNAHDKTGSISDSNRVEETDPKLTPVGKVDEPKTKFSLNKDDIGEKPARIYEVEELKLTDAWNDNGGAGNYTAAGKSGLGYSEKGGSNKHNVKQWPELRINKYSYNYTPSSYSNCAKGSFSVPNVGAHVWIFFREGDPLEPVFWATSYGQSEWKGIYDTLGEDKDVGIDYPGTYENKAKSDDDTYDHNTEQYRNKYVLNQKAGTIEFINSDNKEIMKFTHYSGSFKEFNNHTTTELATHNDQKLVLEDQYLTVRGYQNMYVEHDVDSIIRGDSYRKVGNLKEEYMKAWYDIAVVIADFKQLFEIKRTKPISDKSRKLTSKQQSKSGSHSACPVCSAKVTKPGGHGTQEKYWHLNNKFSSTGVTQVHKAPKGQTWIMSEDAMLGGMMSTTGNEDKVDKYNKCSPKGEQAKASFRPGGASGKIFGETCPCCKGSGKSPSTMDGSWTAESLKKDLDNYIKSNIEKLSDQEAKMGLGGNEIIDITKHKIETIGLVMNDFGSIRVDTVGKIHNNEIVVHKKGVFTNQEESPLIEYVHVDEIPGGNSTLNICNRYNVQVGAGGISMKSYGPVDIGGTITNISGNQVNIGSEFETNIDGGRRLNISADILCLRARNKDNKQQDEQVLVDGNLGVKTNVVIGGGMHVEGEVSVNHITAPCEIQQTEETDVTGTTLGSRVVGWIPPGRVLIGACCPIFNPLPIPIKANIGPFHSDPNCVGVWSHSHLFRNLPLTLHKDHDDVRVKGKKNNDYKKGRVPAEPVRHEKKCGDASSPAKGRFGKPPKR